jgi:[acyl-carrier-protein] S-malonyltransferase
MTINKYGVLFPGCGVKFLGNETEQLGSSNHVLDDLLSRAESVSDFNPSVFINCNKGEFTDELQAQFATYIYSCAMSCTLKNDGILTRCTAGYSMGLYAALFHVESINFEDGIRLIGHAYRCMRNQLQSEKFGVAVVVGLTDDVLNTIIRNCQSNLEIINVNSQVSLVIAGHEKEVLMVMAMALEEGALRVSQLPLSTPYHSTLVSSAVNEFSNIFPDISIVSPAYPIISCTRQNLLKTEIDVKNALTENIGGSINWLKTMEKMIADDIKLFFECGPGDSLTRVCKFIDGDYTIKNMSRYRDIVGHSPKCSGIT